MQLTALLFAASASALSIAAPAPSLGTWDVIVDESFASNGYKAHKIAANFTSPSYPGMSGIISRCSYSYIPQTDGSAPVETKECDPGFDYTLGTTLKVQQTVQLPTEQTVFGEGYITLITTGVGKTATGRTLINATSAIA